MLWVTIRGFAVAASWLEHYKEEARTTTKKSRGLRKKLSQREPDYKKEELNSQPEHCKSHLMGYL